MGSKKNRNRECAYCGGAARSADHIPPKSLFGERRDLIKVPACVRCNVSFSKDDEYFRLALALRDDVYGHPDVKAIIPTIMRSLGKPEKIGFRVAFLGGLSQVHPRTLGGLILPKRGVYTVDPARLERVTQRITKGLYYHHRGHRLPVTHEAFAFSPPTLADMSQETYQMLKRTLLDPVGPEPNRTIGRQVFSYKFRFAEDDPDSSIWLYLFYGRIPFIGMTLRNDQVQS